MPAYASIVLPVLIPKALHYSIPLALQPQIQIGVRVEVALKKKLYAGMVIGLTDTKPAMVSPKPILDILDSTPVLQSIHLKFWHWVSSYYCCYLGEVMAAAMPTALRLSSESIFVLSPFFSDSYDGLNHKEYLVVNALENRTELTIQDIQGVLNQTNVQLVIQNLLDKKQIFLKETLETKFKPQVKDHVRLTEDWSNYKAQSFMVDRMFDLVKRSEHQSNILLAFFEKDSPEVEKNYLLKKTGAPASAIKSMVKKEVFEVFQKEVSRLDTGEKERQDITLSKPQATARKQIESSFEDKNVVLLHGVTGSGKTEVYFKLIQSYLEKGKQALFLLPEIALTTQMISRLNAYFGDEVQVFHSRINTLKRVEIWKSVQANTKIVVGSRSALFLPFKNLGLIIVDEAHDQSYKQTERNPRYHGRDAAIYLAHLTGAKVLLGTATPSVESYYNTKKGKYALVELTERFGEASLPEIELVDKALKMKTKKMQWSYSDVLLNKINEAFQENDQVIIFQNRRGYAPLIYCPSCGWIADCKNCDVSLTYHLYQKNLQCHLCGHTENTPAACPSCGDLALRNKGLGTEKVEEELETLFPQRLIKRMDLDSVRSKKSFTNLIEKFDKGEIDILIGTKMITKGLDFENIGLVGVVGAESLLFFPDFRAVERTFQLLTQVAGRAGRRNKKGKVVIQSYQVDHPVFEEVIKNDFKNFYSREVFERQQFNYPPFTKIITISIRHKKIPQLDIATRVFIGILQKNIPDFVYGPSIPKVSRVRNYYIKNIMLKVPTSYKKMDAIKTLIMKSTAWVIKEKGLGSTRFIIDVDPYN